MRYDIAEWDFRALLWEYFEVKFYFKSNRPWEEYPWFTQVELQRVTAVLNAFTKGNYIVETVVGKKEIEEAFCTGFGHYNDLYTETQAMQIKELFNGYGSFRDLAKMKMPTVGRFYEELFRAFEAGHKYITKFDYVSPQVEKSPIFQILNNFKCEKQDRIIEKANEKICKCMLILLNENFTQIFSLPELIAFYDYPDVENDEIERAKLAYQRERGKFGFQ